MLAAAFLLLAVPLPAAATANAVSSNGATAIVPMWAPATDPAANPRDLHKEYGRIFKYGNRNAASHLWSTFLLDRAPQMTRERLTSMFTGFCAVSGSPVRPHDFNRYRLTLDDVGGGQRSGFMHYCCWPCVCDTQDFIKVDTKTVTTSEGDYQFHFAVLGNPCDRREKLNEQFVQPFGRRTTTLANEAREVRCGPSGELIGATLSDHGFIIISMFFDSVAVEEGGKIAGSGMALASSPSDGDPTPGRMTRGADGRSFQDEYEYGPMCVDRAKHGFNSGMGEIFRKVAAISPINVDVPLLQAA
jgi:hypothetical protein